MLVRDWRKNRMHNPNKLRWCKVNLNDEIVSYLLVI